MDGLKPMTDNTRNVIRKMLDESSIREDAARHEYYLTARKTGIPPLLLQQWIDEMDPTPDQEYAHWILTRLRSDELGEKNSLDRVRNALEQFDAMKRAGEIDMDISRISGLEELERTVGIE